MSLRHFFKHLVRMSQIKLKTFKYVSWIELGNSKITEGCRSFPILGFLDHNLDINTQTQQLSYGDSLNSRQRLGVKRIIKYENLLTWIRVEFINEINVRARFFRPTNWGQLFLPLAQSLKPSSVNHNPHAQIISLSLTFTVN